ncbi:MAG: hypothetical protein UW35_C0027G0009 [Candidatus Collierbacteria bacterium GW2011_GWF2_44_15]|uniref:DUF4177 domain-containing protein n=3 Tax=Candidatus Collieribacteriota TaxID=1752725 RepID=A0A0G1HGB2_9BACT|nr:MAG: hypothetical protein UW23_C0004G0021 [Candidatus Collierbacteria bacterium GW2011_GWA1_44_12]KKT37627.1 MAG: hypothetical protein UW26_C0028G0002 [Candidatus Collierbacteria bacterium GW2011_GWF1_44_12]KKT45930.1 MAG: hypothetical protein UW35_C0027G0009 [Candidatus Collierbacteria bacterium GW2011_GWF2_44_15]
MWEYLELRVNTNRQVVAIHAKNPGLEGPTLRVFAFPDVADELGKLGWELVSVVECDPGYLCYFKRFVEKREIGLC